MFRRLALIFSVIAMGIALNGCTKCGPIWDDWMQHRRNRASRTICRPLQAVIGRAWRRGRRDDMCPRKMQGAPHESFPPGGCHRAC